MGHIHLSEKSKAGPARGGLLGIRMNLLKAYQRIPVLASTVYSVDRYILNLSLMQNVYFSMVAVCLHQDNHTFNLFVSHSE